MPSRVRVVKRLNQSEGAAVPVGMLVAHGERALFINADLATPMHELTNT